jgi:SM-20-related protein
MMSEMIAEELSRSGLSIFPDFLIPSTLRETCADLQSIQAADKLHRAGTGQGNEPQVNDRVRSDHIHWLERTRANPVQTILWDKLDTLRTAFNQALYLGLNDFEGHYAIYPTGGFYKRHTDSFRDDCTRVVSVILYLNENWQSVDGGDLHVYQKDGSYVDIHPVGGTLVCFLSRESEHEVMPSFRPRSSFAGWFKRTRSFANVVGKYS